MAISGHKTLKEVTRYTEAASQKSLAKDAMQKTHGEQQPANHFPRLAKIERNTLKTGG